MAAKDDGTPPAAGRDVADGVRALGLAIERWRGAFARRHGLAENDSVILSMLLAADAGLRPRDLSEPMGVRTGTLTAMLDRLEARRFVSRSPNPADRRSTIIELTRSGRAALAASTHDFEQAVASSIAERDQAGLITHLATMTDTVNELAEHVEHGRTRRRKGARRG